MPTPQLFLLNLTHLPAPEGSGKSGCCWSTSFLAHLCTKSVSDVATGFMTTHLVLWCFNFSLLQKLFHADFHSDWPYYSKMQPLPIFMMLVCVPSKQRSFFSYVLIWSYLLRAIAPLFHAGLLFLFFSKDITLQKYVWWSLKPPETYSQRGTLLWTWMHKGMSLVNRHLYIICIMTLSIPSPLFIPFIIWHWPYIGCQRSVTRPRFGWEHYSTLFGESKIYSCHWLCQKPFSIFKERVEMRIRFNVDQG